MNQITRSIVAAWLLAACALAPAAHAQIKVSELPAASSVADADLTIVVQSGVTKRATAGLVRDGYATDAELAAVQAGAQPLDADLSAIAGLTSAANKLPYATGAGAWSLADFTAAGRALVDDADAATQRTTLGATAAGSTLFTAADAAAQRTALGLVIGTNVEAYDADLAAIAGLTSAAGKVPYFTGTAAAALFDSTSFGRSISNAADAAALRTLAGAGTASTLTSGVATGNLAPVGTGTVLQEVIGTDAGNTTTSTSLTGLSAASVSITPKSASSQLLITVTFKGTSAFLSAVNTIASFRLYDFTNSADIGIEYDLSTTTASGGNGRSDLASISAIVSNAVLTARGFTLRGKTNNASSAAGAQSMVWSIREIKS